MAKAYCNYSDFSDMDCCFNEAVVQLRDCFRLLWEQHVYWTRMVIMGIAFDLPDLEPTTNRLLRNAPDFAKLFSQFYNNEIAAEFCRLVRDHLVIAAELVNAAKAGDSQAADEAERRWYKNANDIVCFLHEINPYWSVEHMRAMWFKHLALTKAEAVAMLNKNYAKGIQIFNQIEQEALLMADTFSMGICSQFDLAGDF